MQLTYALLKRTPNPTLRELVDQAHTPPTRVPVTRFAVLGGLEGHGTPV